MPSRANSQDSDMGAGPSAGPLFATNSSEDAALETRMSPRTVASTLANFPNLDANILRGICKGLCDTLNTHAVDYVMHTAALQERVQTLEADLHACTDDHTTLAKTLQEHAETLEQQLNRTTHPHINDPPEGFKVNEDYPMLYITVTANEMRPAHWIQECSDGKVLSRY
jgi:hypothetical protein